MILNLQEKLQTAITKDVYSQIIEELRSARERVRILLFSQ